MSENRVSSLNPRVYHHLNFLIKIVLLGYTVYHGIPHFQTHFQIMSDIFRNLWCGPGDETDGFSQDYGQRKRMDLGALIDETLEPPMGWLGVLKGLERTFWGENQRAIGKPQIYDVFFIYFF